MPIFLLSAKKLIRAATGGGVSDRWLADCIKGGGKNQRRVGGVGGVAEYRSVLGLRAQ